MNLNRAKKSALTTGVVGAGAVLALAGCSSSSSDNSSSSPAASASQSASKSNNSSALPAPPAGSKNLSTEKEAGDVVYRRYSTSMKPAGVTSYYKTELTGSGYKVTSAGASGGGWGQYGGSGAGLEANNGSNFVAVNAGGSKQGQTFFEVCAGPSSAAVDQCQGNNHGDSNQS